MKYLNALLLLFVTFGLIIFALHSSEKRRNKDLIHDNAQKKPLSVSESRDSEQSTSLVDETYPLEVIVKQKNYVELLIKKNDYTSDRGVQLLDGALLMAAHPAVGVRIETLCDFLKKNEKLLPSVPLALSDKKYILFFGDKEGIPVSQLSEKELQALFTYRNAYETEARIVGVLYAIYVRNDPQGLQEVTEFKKRMEAKYGDTNYGQYFLQTMDALQRAADKERARIFSLK